MAPARASQWTSNYNSYNAAPPGLAPPPGLTPPPPPGLTRTAKKPAKYNRLPIPPPPPLPASAGLEAPAGMEGSSVRVSCLPNHILSKAMLGATLEQAQLDEQLVSFVTQPGMYRGEAIITMKSEEAAASCAQHFHGRRWDASGITVRARLMSEEVKPHAPVHRGGYGGSHPDDQLVADPRLDDFKLLSSYEARVDREGGWDDRNLDTFGEDSCDHNDLVDQLFGGVESGMQHSCFSMLSAGAPEFVPGKMAITVPAETVPVGSDVSTEDGDSASSCDEKDGAVAKA